MEKFETKIYVHVAKAKVLIICKFAVCYRTIKYTLNWICQMADQYEKRKKLYITIIGDTWQNISQERTT